MSEIIIYDYEKSAGLQDQIINSAKACITASIADPTIINTTCEEIAEAKKLNNYSSETMEYIKKNLPPDVMRVDCILASTTWNGNDDVFTPGETIKSYHTAAFKPVNIDHKGKESDKENKIIGVIINSHMVDEDYKYYYPKDKDEVNKPFHVLATAFLWEKYFPESVANIKDSIKKSEQFVSMECLFTDFGYALRKEGSSEVSLLPRDKITSWMTASLRAYKGTGKIKIDGKEYLIGRWIKEFTFSGMGFVKRPANKPSIVFEDYISHASLKFNTISDKNFSKSDESGVLNITDKGTLALWL